jgi:hypothetical protein
MPMPPSGIVPNALRLEVTSLFRQTRLLKLVANTQPVAPTVTVFHGGFFGSTPPTLTQPATNPIFTTINVVGNSFVLGLAADAELPVGGYTVTLTGVAMGSALGPTGTTISIFTPNGALTLFFVSL